MKNTYYFYFNDDKIEKYNYTILIQVLDYLKINFEVNLQHINKTDELIIIRKLKVDINNIIKILEIYAEIKSKEESKT